MQADHNLLQTRQQHKGQKENVDNNTTLQISRLEKHKGEKIDGKKKVYYFFF